MYLHYICVHLLVFALQQKSAGSNCPYCRCEIKGTESILIEPYLRDSSQWEEESDDREDEDHEDIEVVIKQMAALKKVCPIAVFSCCFLH